MEITDYGLDLHGQMIIEEYRDQLPSFEKMKQIVTDRLQQCLDENGIHVTALESRIKTEASLAGKLHLKGYKYNFLSDLTDILGARVITFYTDEVDKIAALAESIFDVDRDQSVDKRKMHEINSFGYMSLHYICRIPKSLYFDEAHPEINEFRFELQMRTALQHVWANMYHDTGYKSGVEVPATYLRSLTRLAGLLELADEQFSRIRKEITDYRRNVQSLVADGNFDAVPLNGDTFNSYMKLNPYGELTKRIAAINQAEVYQDNMTKYLDIFVKLGFKTLGDLESMRLKCSEGAYQLALHQIGSTDLDIITSSLALQNLCIIYILSKGGGATGLAFFYNALGGNEAYNRDRAERTYAQAKAVKLDIGLKNEKE